MAYDDVMRQRVLLGGERIVLLGKAGMVGWDEVAVASALLAESAELAPGMRVLLLEGGTGALAVWAARHGADVHYYDGSLIAARMARQTLDANPIAGVTIHEAACPPPEEAGAFDLALLPLPKGRACTQALFGEACRALRPGGRLYFAGPNAGGAKAMVGDAKAIFGHAVTVRTKARNRIAMAIRQPGTPGPLPLLEPQPFEAPGLTLFSMPGVFSRGGLDDGTAMLLETLDAAQCAGKRVLDVGCGYGVIGLVAARLGAAAVDLIDSQWVALACAAEGVAANGLEAVCSVRGSDLYSDVVGEPYDLILSNPPFHAGHKVDTGAAVALIAGARERLQRGGRLRLVANRFLPYDRLMADTFGAGRVAVVAEDSRYRVLEAVR